MKLKPEQEKAIFTKDKDILVSAGAGSGKTFVMIERIANSIIKGKKSVTNLLVVTFTNAAAGEMRAKLERKLRDEIANGNLSTDEIVHTRKQLDMLGQADICTLHKFCQNLIKKYFYCLDIDPAFNIVDENESKVLSTNALEHVLKVASLDPHYEDVFLAFDSKRNYDKVQEIVEKTYNFLSNQPNLSQFRKQVESSFLGGIDGNQFSKTINQYIIRVFNFYKTRFEKIKQDAIVNSYVKLAETCDNVLGVIGNISETNAFSQNNFVLQNLPRMANMPSQDKVPEGCLGIYEKAKSTKNDLSAKIKDIRDNICLGEDAEVLLTDLEYSHKLMNIVFDLVENYRIEYAKLKKERNVLDFGDLEHYALQVLKNTQIAEQVREYYQQIYVDEYQDINDIQESIISNIYTPHNLFLVGDVKQSIYGFRNTNPQIFIDKSVCFGNEGNVEQEALPLNYNFRSDQKVLDYINVVFGDIMTTDLAGLDYANTSKMQAGLDFLSISNSMPIVKVNILRRNEDKKEKTIPEGVYSVANAPMADSTEQDEAKSEAQIIITEITNFMQTQKQIFDPKIQAMREITLDDITLLARSRGDYLDTIIKEIATIYPIETISKDTIFNEYEVQVLYCYLRLMNNMCDDKSLLTCLLSPICDVNENELADIKVKYPNCEKFYQCVQEYMSLKLDDAITGKISKLLNYIDIGKVKLQNGNIFDVLNWFVNETHYGSMLSLMDNGEQKIKNIRGFINSFVGRSYNNSLFSYMDYVENSSTEPKVNADNISEQSVIHVATMHESKGLEYPIVFLVDTGHGFNRDSMKGDILLSSTLGLGLYYYDYDNRIRRSTLARSAIKINLAEKDFAENQRLLYVAMTRAKNNLYIIGKQKISKLTDDKTEYSIRQSESNMALILSTLSTSDINSLQMGKNELIINEGKVGEYVINVFDCVPHEDKGSPILNKPIKISAYDPEFEMQIHKYFDYIYPYQNSINKAYKNTVTGLLKSQTEENTNFVNTPKTFEINENKVAVTNAEIGTLYHKIMQGIDFNFDSINEVNDYCKNNLTSDELKQVDCSKILACIRSVRPLIVNADLVLREQPFLMNIPYNEIIENSEIKDTILVQGIIDLVIVKNGEAVLLDYKMTSITNAQKLIEKYKLQLECYKKAIQSALNCEVKTKILYSFLQEIQIIV